MAQHIMGGFLWVGGNRGPICWGFVPGIALDSYQQYNSQQLKCAIGSIHSTPIISHLIENKRINPIYRGENIGPHENKDSVIFQVG